jgi:putative oxidoreductase
MRAVFVLGRVIFGGYFAWSGLNHFLEEKQLSSSALLLAGGFSVTGVKPRQGLAAIVAFLIPVSMQMDRFWEVDDPQQRMTEMINFTKNMALAGAALMMMQLDEPWPASVDAARREGEEMYVRVGGRELRGLPA